MIADLPELPPKVLVHGDYFPGNVLLARRSFRVGGARLRRVHGRRRPDARSRRLVPDARADRGMHGRRCALRARADHRAARAGDRAGAPLLPRLSRVLDGGPGERRAALPEALRLEHRDAQAAGGGAPLAGVANSAGSKSYFVPQNSQVTEIAPSSVLSAISSAVKLDEHAGDLLARAGALVADAGGAEDADAALVEQAEEQLLDRHRRVGQLVVLDRADERTAPRPRRRPRSTIDFGAFRRVAAGKVAAGACAPAPRAETGRAARRRATNGGWRRPRARASRRRRGGRASGSAPTGGNRCARLPRGFRLRAARRPDSGWCACPDRWSWRACPCRAARRASRRRRLRRRATRSRSKRA